MAYIFINREHLDTDPCEERVSVETEIRVIFIQAKEHKDCQ